MPRNVLIFIFLVFLASVGVFMFTSENVTAPTVQLKDRPQDTPYQEEAYKNRRMSLQAYIGSHISELSPVQEVLGGKFYVSEVTAENGEGIVRYEDGHKAYVADFKYTESGETGYAITKFTVREN